MYHILRSITWLHDNIHSLSDLKALCTTVYMGSDIAGEACEASFFVFEILWALVMILVIGLTIKVFSTKDEGRMVYR